MQILRMLLLPLVASVAFAQTPAAPLPINHEFDFWIGSWEVTANGKLAGHNRIESILGGRVLQENYTTPGAYAGHSFNIYNAAEARWEQYWVDVGGLALHLTGGLNETGQMVLSGATKQTDGSVVLERITWTPNDDGTVRQHWEQSRDDGETWATAFDGLYTPMASP